MIDADDIKREAQNVVMTGDDFGTNREELASEFAHAMMSIHKAALDSDDKEVRDAVVVKTVALIALAFGIPAIKEEPLNIPEALSKLAGALATLKLKGFQ